MKLRFIFVLILVVNTIGLSEVSKVKYCEVILVIYKLQGCPAGPGYYRGYRTACHDTCKPVVICNCNQCPICPKKQG